METETAATPGVDRMRGGALGEDLSFLLARANAVSVASANAALAPFELRVRSYAVLAVVAEDARPSQRDLSEFLRLDPSQVVALVDDLQSRGLVAREQDPRDRRARVIVVTSAGRALFGRAREATANAERALHGALSTREREQLSGMLYRIAFGA